AGAPAAPPPSGAGGEMTGDGGAPNTGTGGASGAVVSSSGGRSAGRDGMGGGAAGIGTPIPRGADASIATGGAPSSPDGGGSVDAGPACRPGEKICRKDGMCWAIAPTTGCDLDDACTPCPMPPANGFSKCTNQVCDFDCLSGFEKDAQGTGCARPGA